VRSSPWTGLAIAPGLPGPLAVTVVILGARSAALLGLIPALARAYFGASEIVTTLLFNYVALYLMQYLIFGSGSYWRDRTSRSFPQASHCPT
jgi:simple sugar transport system permease protein